MVDCAVAARVCEPGTGLQARRMFEYSLHVLGPVLFQIKRRHFVRVRIGHRIEWNVALTPGHIHAANEREGVERKSPASG